MSTLSTNQLTFEEVFNHPKVQQLVKKYISKHREPMAREFYKVWKRHYNSWESIERKEQHSLDNIKKIVWDGTEKCFKVYYKKTEHYSEVWYHYCLDGTWY